MIEEIISAGIPVMINIPTQAPFVKNASAKRQYNHKVAKITEVEVKNRRCRINLDGGCFYWEPEILCPIRQKKCKNDEIGERDEKEE